ncbi:MAG: hypothetical protein ACP5E3_13890, partial [Bacteroidales bacterium]
MKSLLSVTGIFLAIFLFLSACTNNDWKTLEERTDNITKAELQSITELLGDDLYEGRAPGTRGGDLSEIYIKSLFKFM